MPIPLTKDVKITPGVIKATGSAVDLNGLILTASPYIPTGGVMGFESSEQVSNFFGAASDEFNVSKIYFKGVKSGTKTPEILLFSRFNSTASAATLRSYPLTISVNELKALSGDLIIDINGTEKTATVNLTTVTSFAEAAQAIETGFSGDVTVVFDTDVKSFILTVDVGTPETSTISYASGTIADGLSLSAGRGAFLSQGADASQADTLFASITDKNQNWAGVTTLFEATTEQHLDLSKWVHDSEYRFFYVAWTTSDTALINDSTETIANKIKEEKYSNVIPVYCIDNTKPASILGYAASLNFDRINGRVPLKFRTLDDLTPDVTESAVYDTLSGNGYSFYGQYAANVNKFNYWADGAITGDFRWADAYCGQIWLNANLQAAIIRLFMSNKSVPYNREGRALVESCMLSTLEQFKNWGGISTGTDLDDSQKSQIKDIVGVDVSDSLIAKGFYIYIGKFTSIMRAKRTTPEVYLFYTDGGSMQKLYMKSLEVE